MQMRLTQLREFAERYTAAWCSQVPSQVAAFFSPHGSLAMNSSAPAVGRTSISEIAQSFMSSFPDLHLKMDDVVIQGDRAVYHWTFTGTNTGPRGTGQRVRFSGFEIWKIADDGQIAESKGHFDEANYRYQLEHGIKL